MHSTITSKILVLMLLRKLNYIEGRSVGLSFELVF